MSAVKERILGAVTVMDEKDAAKGHCRKEHAHADFKSINRHNRTHKHRLQEALANLNAGKGIEHDLIEDSNKD